MHLAFFCSPQGCVSRKNRIFNAETVFNRKAGGTFRWKERIFSGNIGAVLIFFMAARAACQDIIFLRGESERRPSYRVPEDGAFEPAMADFGENGERKAEYKKRGKEF